MRQSFARLKPQETSELAERVARLHGAEGSAASLVAMNYETSEQDLHAGVRLEAALVDGLVGWVT